MWVLSSSKIGTSSWRYYTDGVACGATEYYAGVGEAPGQWAGRGLDELGLVSGERVTEQQLEGLFGRGLHPQTGQRLGRAWRTDAVTGFDLTLSAPKSVSVLWALGESETPGAVSAAHDAAVAASLGYLDTHAGLSRSGTDGLLQVGTQGLAVALFDHRTSRAGDPQLHTHALVLNKVRCADRVWRTLDAAELYHHKKSAGVLYQAALRNELHRRLGVVFGDVSENGQAEVAGVPGQLVRMFSKRTAQISAEAEPKIAEYEAALGRPLSATERIGVVKTAVLKTRTGKEHQHLAVLRQRWLGEAGAAGWTAQRLWQAVREAARRVLPATIGRDPSELSGTWPPATAHVATSPPFDREGLVREALLAAGRRRAVFSRADLACQVAARFPTAGLSAQQTVRQVELLTSSAVRHAEAVSVGEHPRSVTSRASDARFSTQEVLTAEARILLLAATGNNRDGQRDADITPGPESLLTVEAVCRDRQLDTAQRGAVARLAGGREFLSVLTAPAGAGKTSTLGAATAVWEAAGLRVVGLAPSARAAAELATATGGHTDTLAKWLHSQEVLERLPPAQRTVAWGHTDARTVLVVDEASMANTLDLDRLTTLAAQAGARVVLVGDPAQIGVVNGPGGMLAALVHAGHGFELSEIHRFTEPWEGQASLGLRAGDRNGLAEYGSRGRLHPCPDGDSALDGVFDTWRRAQTDGQQALMLARTRVDVDALNQRARQAALERGEVFGPALHAGDREWRAGDLLRTRRNDRQLPLGDGHVRNGDRFRVQALTPTGGLLVQDLAGRGLGELPAAYLAEHVEYGWASTIDAAQGATTDIGVVLVRPGLDREHLYVAMTRGRLANHAFIAPDPTSTDEDHEPGHGTPARPSEPLDDLEVKRRAGSVILDALAHSGAQDAAHTARDTARTTATARAAAEVRAEVGPRMGNASADGARPTARYRGQAAGHEPGSKAAAVLRRSLLTQQRNQVAQRVAAGTADLRAALEELESSPRWSRGRRRDLTNAATAHQVTLTKNQQRLTKLDAELTELHRQAPQPTESTRAEPTPEEVRRRDAVGAAWRRAQQPWRPSGPGVVPTPTGTISAGRPAARTTPGETGARRR